MVMERRPAARRREEGHGQDDFFPLPPFRQDSVPRKRASCPKLLSEQLLWSHLHLWGLEVILQYKFMACHFGAVSDAQNRKGKSDISNSADFK